MSETVHHRNNVILNVTQVQADVHTRSDLVVRVAALGKATKDVRLSTQQLHEAHDILANSANLAKEWLRIIRPSNEYLVLDDIGLLLELVDDGLEGINDVITV
jgi:hypothetical protein